MKILKKFGILILGIVVMCVIVTIGLSIIFLCFEYPILAGVFTTVFCSIIYYSWFVK